MRRKVSSHGVSCHHATNYKVLKHSRRAELNSTLPENPTLVHLLFQRNKTAIIDVDGGRCFIMPLDRDEIPRPRNIFDMLNNMKDGAYEVDFEEVKHNTRVVLPPVRNLDGFG